MPIVMGINHSMHESSVAFVDDSGVLFAQSEERRTRRKSEPSFPSEAIAAGMGVLGINHTDIAAIGFSFPARHVGLLSNLQLLMCGEMQWSRHNALSLVVGATQPRNRSPWVRASSVPVYEFSHHLSHGLTATLGAGMEEAAVIVADGRGARSATSIWHFRNGAMQLLRRVSFPNSLGLFYAEITRYLGFQPLSDEWKVMGLAAYGKAGIDLSHTIRVTSDGYQVRGRELIGKGGGDLTHLLRHLGGRGTDVNLEAGLAEHDRNVAFAAQAATEEAMLALARTAYRLTGARALCLSGGVAMNCKANGRILAEGPFQEVFVPAGASDEGSSIGAGVAALERLGYRPEVKQQPHALLGMAYRSQEVEELLQGCGLRFRLVSDPEERAAELLASGTVLARFRGRSEFGARALGARSILVHPGDIAVRDRINGAVKYREPWRPFAPMVLEEDAASYFSGFVRSPFMTLTFDVTERARREAPAIVHADGTARVQSVGRGDDPLLWKLLTSFKHATGSSVLLNTSFNLKGEPIVETPRDAIRTFFASGLERLLLEDYEVWK